MQATERHAGTLAPVIALGGILLATVLDPTFSWTGDALSNLGVRTASRTTFNGALMMGGLLALVYARGLWQESSASGGRLVAGVFGLAGMHLAGVGFFVIGHPLHLPAAVGFYLLITVVFVVDGLRRRSTRSGRLTLALALGQGLIWTTWGMGRWPVDGLALPEFAGAMLVPLWIWFVGPRPTLLLR